MLTRRPTRRHLLWALAAAVVAAIVAVVAWLGRASRCC